MSDTPQNDSVESEVIDPQIETNDSVVESETTTPVEGESQQQVDEVELAKQKSNEAFNRQYGQLKQSERNEQAAQARIAEFEKAERERQAAAVGEIPSMPDAFDDDYDAKIKARDEAIVAQANFNNSNQIYLQQQQHQQQQEAQAKQAEIQQSMQAYSTKATELGINQAELQAAGNTVAQYGLSDDLVMHILADSDGPLITKHLAANPQEGFELAQMSPFAVGSKLDAIRAKAAALKPKQSNTPDPATNLSGNGADPEAGKYSHIKGAKFE